MKKILNPSIRTALLTSFAFIALTAILAGVIEQQSMEKVNMKAEDLALSAQQLQAGAGKMKYIVVNIQRIAMNSILAEDEEMLVLAPIESNRFYELVEEMSSLLGAGEPDIRKRLNNLQIDYRNFLTSVLSMSAQFVEGIETSKDKLAEINLSAQHFIDYLNELTEQINQISKRNIDEIHDHHRNSFVVNLISLGTIFIAIIGALFFMERRLSRPLSNLMSFVRGLTGEEDGLSKRISLKGRDEIGELAASLNSMLDSLEKTTVSRNLLMEEVAERKRTENALRQSEETTRALLNATSDSAILIDTEGTIFAINEIAVHRLGKIKNNVVRTDIFNLFPPDIAKERKAIADKVIHSGEPIQFEDQSEGLVFNNTFYPIFDRRGKVEKLAVYSRDITDQRRTEEHQQRIEQMKLVGEWAVGLAQEIKNPLAGIKVSIEVLLEELKISTEDRAVVLKAVDEIKRIEVLLKSLLNFAKPTKLQLTIVDMNELLDQTITFSSRHPFLSSTPLKKIKVSKQFDENLPGMMVDPMQLQQVFLNLALNAIEAMPDGGMLDVKSIYDKNTDAIKIEISDTGEGIDKGMMEDVFKPFFTTKTKGSGLGLAITRRVVEQHGGVISVKSDPGKRTTFNVYLPLITSSDKEIDVISTTE